VAAWWPRDGSKWLMWWLATITKEGSPIERHFEALKRGTSGVGCL